MRLTTDYDSFPFLVCMNLKLIGYLRFVFVGNISRRIELRSLYVKDRLQPRSHVRVVNYLLVVLSNMDNVSSENWNKFIKTAHSRTQQTQFAIAH